MCDLFVTKLQVIRTNARNGKSMSKISKWPSLRAPAREIETFWYLNFLKNKISMEKVVGEQGPLKLKDIWIYGLA